MVTKPLTLVEKIAVLEAIVEAHYEVSTAARRLGVSPATLYRKLRRWGLTPPMFSPQAGQPVLRRDFAQRCSEINLELRRLVGAAVPVGDDLSLSIRPGRASEVVGED